MKAHDIRRFAAAITRLATDTGRWGDLGYAPSTLDADIGRYNTALQQVDADLGLPIATRTIG